MTFENENEIEQIESDVSSESSSETQDPSASPAAPKEAASTEQTKPDTTPPFHEHPRFKELVEQKNQYAQQIQELKNQFAEMQRQAQPKAAPTPDKRAQMIERLKGIDPEFADFVAELAPTKELQELRQKYAQVEAEKMRSEAVNTVKDLHSQNKVPAELQDLYNTQLEIAAARNPNLTVKDIPLLYKQVHDGMSKILEGVKRSERESYLAGKKADVKAPTSQPKGKPASPSGKFEFSKNPEEARAQLISRVLKQSKASSEL